MQRINGLTLKEAVDLTDSLVGKYKESLGAEYNSLRIRMVKVLRETSCINVESAEIERLNTEVVKLQKRINKAVGELLG